MTLFDYTVFVIIGSSVVLSVMRGFAREVLALAGWVIAFLAANTLSGFVAEWFASSIRDGSVRALTAFVLVFVVTLILASVLGIAVSKLLRTAGLGLEDR